MRNAVIVMSGSNEAAAWELAPTIKTNVPDKLARHMIYKRYPCSVRSPHQT